ncbi:Uncharacterised protein [Citrobacter koseri]|uniref:Uncharacterized protein n=1 Tax=Citrobacter koseri TaxID=545 RepID=A0A2X2WNN3_CITKO|nr:Uncharacterised protein [Citrobacter koseri]
MAASPYPAYVLHFCRPGKRSATGHKAGCRLHLIRPTFCTSVGPVSVAPPAQSRMAALPYPAYDLHLCRPGKRSATGHKASKLTLAILPQQLTRLVVRRLQHHPTD